MPVSCCRTASITPMRSGRRHSVRTPSRQVAASRVVVDGGLDGVEVRVDVAGALHLRAGRARPPRAGPPSRTTGASRGAASTATTNRTAGMAETPSIARHAARVAQEVVDEVGDEDPDGDGQLVERDEPAPQAGRGHLGCVQGSGHRGHADPEADDEAADAPARRSPGRSASTRAPTVKRTAASRMVSRRPSRSASAPATRAPTMAPSVTQLVMTSRRRVPT